MVTISNISYSGQETQVGRRLGEAGVSTPGAGLCLSQVSRVPLSSKSLPSVEDTLFLYVLSPVNLPTSIQHDSWEVLPDAPITAPSTSPGCSSPAVPRGNWAAHCLPHLLYLFINKNADLE